MTFIFVQCHNPKQNENTTAITEIKKDSSTIKENIESSNKSSTESEITCPECGYKKMEILPTDVCLIKYTCDSCTSVSYSKDGDCCVFCSYGTHKCPSKQVE
jgi:hypothetical protein